MANLQRKMEYEFYYENSWLKESCVICNVKIPPKDYRVRGNFCGACNALTYGNSKHKGKENKAENKKLKTLLSALCENNYENV